ncbi:hypothetical protein [Endozoicomonas acroporae]|uniref:hypothetical protein n=1 Tax=Endozoicomonas acroporae TaxID=1701104 RepID=UPI001456B2A0|nr:hypothetical protein [Endozoicomonas acroporae]
MPPVDQRNPFADLAKGIFRQVKGQFHGAEIIQRGQHGTDIDKGTNALFMEAQHAGKRCFQRIE